jgi:hypothetical protein
MPNVNLISYLFISFTDANPSSVACLSADGIMKPTETAVVRERL